MVSQKTCKKDFYIDTLIFIAFLISACRCNTIKLGV